MSELESYIGKLKIDSGKLLVTDPCYIPDSLHDGDGTHEVEVPTGEHRCFVKLWDDRKTGGWGDRVAELRIEFRPSAYGVHEKVIGSADVDSGQMSFMDAALIPEWGGDEREGGWAPEKHRGEFNYQGACEVTLRNDDCSGAGLLDNKMAVSCTGYGDGGYPVYAGYYQGDLVYLRVEFLGEEDPEDY